MSTDPLAPAPPRPAYFDEAVEAWVLSRYADVTAAFRDPRLWTIGLRGEDQHTIRDETGKLRGREDLPAMVSPTKVAKWQPQMELLAESAAAMLPRERPVGRSSELAQPWALARA